MIYERVFRHGNVSVRTLALPIGVLFAHPISIFFLYTYSIRLYTHKCINLSETSESADERLRPFVPFVLRKSKS